MYLGHFSRIGSFLLFSLLRLGGKYQVPIPSRSREEAQLPSPEPHVENEANWKPKIKHYLHSIFQEVKKNVLLC